VKKPENYFWSNYQATIGIQKTPVFLTTNWTLAQFGKQQSIAQKKYIDFVYDGIDAPNPWDDLCGQIFLGKKNFLGSLEKLIKEKANISEIPRAQRFVIKKTNAEIKALAKTPKKRNEKINELHHKKGIPINQIAKFFSLHHSTISKIIKKSIKS
jgi:hypothetical protein